jgi:hypothetical protein
MTIKNFLFSVLIFINFISFSQINEVKIDSNLICDHFSISDSIIFNFKDSLDQPLKLIYPINSNVKFESNFDISILHTTSAKLINDTIIIFMKERSFGSEIEIKLTKIHHKIDTKISYWSVPGNVITFTEKNTILTLKQDNFENEDYLIGNIKIDFKGEINGEMYPNSLKVNGKVDGCFNIVIDKN